MNKTAYQKIVDNPEPVTRKDWEGVPKEDRQYLSRLNSHKCLRCGAPLPSSSIQTICKDCRAEDRRKHHGEYERAKRTKYSHVRQVRVYTGIGSGNWRNFEED